MKRYIYLLATDQRNAAFDQGIKIILKGLSFLYGAVINLRNILYDLNVFKAYNIGVPVISIGNITMGGAGKTPLVIFFAQSLLERGFKPVILIRGYMGAEGKGQASDEVSLLKAKLGSVDVLPGADRIENAKRYLQNNRCDVFILDDGFQHRKISRDLNILAVDATNPFGNGALIPRGILREPLSGLSRSDMVILTRSDLGRDKIAAVKNTVKQKNPNAETIETVHRPVKFVDVKRGEESRLSALRGKAVLAFCAIGNPAGFEATLKGLDVDVRDLEIFPDHHAFAPDDIERLEKKCAELGVTAMVTTAKDAVKLQEHINKMKDQIKWFYLDIMIEVSQGHEQIVRRVDSLLRR